MLKINHFGAIAFVMLTATSGTAMAQTTVQQDDEVVSDPVYDIVVTAQRRSEKVQDIPVAISAFGAEQIERSGVVSIENIAPRVPSFYFGSFGATRPQLYIRGIGTRSFDPGSESSVGVFSDDVYMGRSSGSFGTMKDIERVEVLRGPQGTLYGRNTIGGAINVISKAPTPEFTGNFEAGVSNFDGYEVFGAVSGPIAGDKIMFRAAGWTVQRDGYVRNVATGKAFQGIDNKGGRLRVTLAPVDQLKIDLTAEFTEDGDASGFGGFNQGTFGAPGVVFFKGGRRVPTVNTGDLREGTLSFDPFLDRNARSLIGRIEYEGEAFTLTSISANRRLRTKDGRDLEGSSLSVLDQLSREKSQQFTQEVRLTSAPDGSLSLGGKIDWILGGFYYRDTSVRADTFVLGTDSAVRAAAGTSATDVASSDYKIESYAVFGQAVIHLTDALDVTLGGRYSHDSKRAVQTGTTTDGAPIIAAPFTTTNSATYKSFDPRIVVSYKLSGDANVYASYSTGFKSGGFQYVPFSKAQADVLFAPEDIKAYEVGFKSEWLDRAFLFNVAGFKYDYKNLQVSRIILAGNAPVSLITNAASSTIKGVDLEIGLRPTRNFRINIAYGYLDAKYDNYAFNATTDFSGTRMVRAPKHSMNMGAEWEAELGGDTRLILRADYALTGTFFHEPGEGNIRFGTGIPLTREASYGLLDLRATLSNGPWQLTAYASNAGDVSYRRTVNALGSTVVGFAGAPRIYGAKIGYSF
ncbi:TonB-dependent receptor [Novosphingobium sp. MMS21-SN21R]|uniref:TonB-dependent receptor n=1 Tax=Novosphingobium sp. MMS21-SN21R TaxID=2969298 RepID=UPI0028858AA6|nr:TonB-dependent receptor [Novosphingobium sp. MMS21-SN21R]MDT0508472.1 TonB-dependent receptor [Novosphingobium sp. MMS21-SN21R]